MGDCMCYPGCSGTRFILCHASTAASTGKNMPRTYGLWWYAKHWDVHITGNLLIGFQAHIDLLRDILYVISFGAVRITRLKKSNFPPDAPFGYQYSQGNKLAGFSERVSLRTGLYPPKGTWDMCFGSTTCPSIMSCPKGCTSTLWFMAAASVEHGKHDSS